MDDLFLLHVAGDEVAMTSLVVALDDVGIRDPVIEVIARKETREIPHRVGMLVKRARYGALLVTARFPVLPWPEITPAELQSIIDRLIFVCDGVPRTVVSRMHSAAGRFEVIESHGDAQGVAAHIARILSADPSTMFKQEEAARRDAQLRWAIMTAFVQRELGILHPDVFAQLAKLTGSSDWPDQVAAAVGVDGGWVRSARTQHAALDDAAAVVAIARRLRDGNRANADEPTSQSAIVRAPSNSVDDGARDADAVLPPRRRRVFISSTFRDMHAERDLLGRFVFPQLREHGRRTGVNVAEIDLRWGVTDDEIEQGELLERCLTEIDESLYFMAILGDRYGSVPEAIDELAMQRWPFLRGASGMSVMDIEATYGGLQANTRSLFFARLPVYGQSVPESVRSEFAESEDGTRRLDDLKARIRASGHTLIEYVTPEEFAWLAQDSLKALVDADLSEFRTLRKRGSALVGEQADFIDLATLHTIQRHDYLRRIDLHVSTSSDPLTILGAAGSGKTVLLAQWVQHRQRTSPETIVIFFSTEASEVALVDWSAAGDVVVALLDRLDMRGFRPEATRLQDQLVELVSAWQDRTGRRDRPILVLDALDRVRFGFSLHEGTMLGDLGTACQMICSLDEANGAAQTGHTIRIEGLDKAARRAIGAAFLSRYGKRLSKDALDIIESAPQMACPRFLTTVLGELRLFGHHDQLTDRLQWYLESETLTDLFDRVLSRMEADYEQDRPHLVRDALCLIWASRRGLPEDNLLSMLGSGGALQGHLWAPIRTTLAESLRRTLHGLDFTHDAIREAVRRRYLARREDAVACHRKLVLYMITGRGIDRLGNHALRWLEQLDAGEFWNMLADELSKEKALLRVWRGERQDPEAVIRYWRNIEASSSITLQQRYASVIEQPHACDIEMVAAVAVLLSELGYCALVRDMARRLEDPPRDSSVAELPERSSRYFEVLHALQSLSQDTGCRERCRAPSCRAPP